MVSKAPYKRRGHPRLSLAVYCSRKRCMRLLGGVGRRLAQQYLTKDINPHRKMPQKGEVEYLRGLPKKEPTCYEHFQRNYRHRKESNRYLEGTHGEQVTLLTYVIDHDAKVVKSEHPTQYSIGDSCITHRPD